MRKIRIIVLLLTVALLLPACKDLSSSSSGTKSMPTPKSAHSTAVESASQTVSSKAPSSAPSKTEQLQSGDYKDTGNGTLIISTPSGTSENGNIPIIYVSADNMGSIGVSVRNFDGSKLSYVYIDRNLNDKEQYGNTDTSIYLNNDVETAGKHEIEIVQYDTDKPDGKIVTYKSAPFEVKKK